MLALPRATTFSKEQGGSQKVVSLWALSYNILTVSPRVNCRARVLKLLWSLYTFMLLKTAKRTGAVAHACNLSPLGDLGRQIT